MTRDEMKKKQATRAVARRFEIHRPGLVERAVAVGKQLKKAYPGLDTRIAWWRELAPLTPAERQQAREQV